MYHVASADHLLWIPDVALWTTHYSEALDSSRSSLLVHMTSFPHPLRLLRRILLLSQIEEPLSDEGKRPAFNRSAHIRAIKVQQGGNLDDAFAFMEPELKELREALRLGRFGSVEITRDVCHGPLYEQIESGSALKCLPREVPHHLLYTWAVGKPFNILQHDQFPAEDLHRLFELILATSASPLLSHAQPLPSTLETGGAAHLIRFGATLTVRVVAKQNIPALLIQRGKRQAKCGEL